MITGKTKVYGLIGHPVEHSFSPQLHYMLATSLAVDMVYTTFDVEKSALKASIEGIKALNISGVNVTVPHKVAVMKYLDAIDIAAMRIGAVNTIVREGNVLTGYNTDYLGLKMALDYEKIFLKDEDILIIGAGGAARAVAVMCGYANVRKITVVNRTIEKAEELVKTIKEYFDIETEVIIMEELVELENMGIVFQTTSLGMFPNIKNNPLKDNIDYSKMKVAVDLIFNPIETEFLAKARKAGVKTMNGLGMLYYQGVKAFELWHGIIPEKSVLDKNFQLFINDRQ
ncbi:MAG: shikimate dehydrogenase [Candidatus Izimaplasma sp.]|nr:shikimate dehydrogenase [Candidatus Izimaplasma bacterium]